MIYAGVSTRGNGLLKVMSKSGKDVIYAGIGVDGDGELWVNSKTGKALVRAGAGKATVG